MKPRRFLLPLGVTLAVTLIAGCGILPEPECLDCDWDWGLSHIPKVTVLQPEVIMADEQDTVTAEVVVEVASSGGQVRPNVEVYVEIVRTQIGFLEYQDPVRRNTTDSLGRLYLYYRGVAPGGNVISAISPTGLIDFDTVRVYLQRPPVGSVVCSVQPETLHVVPGRIDSTQLEIRVESDQNVPLRDYRVAVTLSRGRLAANPLLPTDTLGLVSAWWYHGAQYGRHYAIPQYADTHFYRTYWDTAWVTVLP